MATCTSQLVEFVGSELKSSGLCHIVFLINKGSNNYLKWTNVDRNEPGGFYRHSKLTNFWAFWHFRSFFEPDFKINNFYFGPNAALKKIEIYFLRILKAK